MKKLSNKLFSLLMAVSMFVSQANSLTLTTYAEEIEETPTVSEEVVEETGSTVVDDEMAEAEEESADLAEESETTEADEEKEDEEQKDEKKDEEKVDVSSLNGMDFSSKRLLVATDSMDDEAVVGTYNNVYLLQYESEYDAKVAYLDYSKTAYFVDVDTIVTVADEANVSGGEMTEEANPIAELSEEVSEISAVDQGKIVLIDTGANVNVVDAVSVIGDATADDNGHGTDMANAIVAQNKDAKIVSIKALDASGHGTVSSIYAGIKLATEMNADFINLSINGFATAENESIRIAIQEAVANGITVIGAAGNNGKDAQYYVPANVSEAIIVGACDTEGNRLASSNYGATVDFNVVATSTSEASAKMTGIVSKTGKAEADNKLVFATDYVAPKEEEKKDDAKKEDGTVTDKDGVEIPLTEDALSNTEAFIEEGYDKTTEYSVIVDYLFIDASRTSIDDSITDIMNKYKEAALAFEEEQVPVFKDEDGNYYFLANTPYRNNYAVADILGYDFAYGNNKGEVITKGVSFDPSTKIAKVKKEVFENADGEFSDIQLQVAVPVDLKKDATIPYRLTSDSTKHAIQYKDGLTVRPFMQVSFKLVDDIICDSITSKNIKLYVNGKNYDDFLYDETTGYVLLKDRAISVYSITAQVDENTEFRTAYTVEWHDVYGRETKLNTSQTVGRAGALAGYLAPGQDFSGLYVGAVTYADSLGVADPIAWGDDFSCRSSVDGHIVRPAEAWNVGTDWDCVTAGRNVTKNYALGIPDYGFGINMRLYNDADGTSAKPYIINNNTNYFAQWSANWPIAVGCIHVTASDATGPWFYTAQMTVIDKQVLSDGLTHVVIALIEHAYGTTGTDSTTFQAAGAVFEIAYKDQAYFKVHKASANPEMTDNNFCYPSQTDEDGEWIAIDFTDVEYGLYSDKECTELVKTLPLDKDGFSETVEVDGGKTYYLKETKTIDGFLLNEKIEQVIATGSETKPSVVDVEDVPDNDPVLIVLKKKSSDPSKQDRIAGAQYTVNYYAGYYTVRDTGEEQYVIDEDGKRIEEPTKSWVFETDESGRIQLSDDYLVSGELYHDQAGVATIPYGTITIEETKAPEGFACNAGFIKFNNGQAYFQITKDDHPEGIMDDNAYTDSEEPIEIGTKATDKATGSHDLPNDGELKTIVDVISYTNLNTNHEYTVSGYLMDKSTEEPLLINGEMVTAEKTFTPKTSNGTVTLEYTVNTKDLPITGEHEYVVFEDIHRDDEREVATHHEINDYSQTIRFVEVKTTAISDEYGSDHIQALDKVQKIDDIVDIKGMDTNTDEVASYTLTATLMDKETGEPVEIDGRTYSATKTFVPTETDMTVKMQISINLKPIEGKSVVFFESLTKNTKDGKSVKVAGHEDLLDENQDIIVANIGTQADIDKTVDAIDKDSVIVLRDKVKYVGLIPDKSYSLNAILMNKKTGEVFTDSQGNTYTVSKTFVAEASEGTVELEISVKASELTTSVVYYEALEVDGIECIFHADIEDKGQSIPHIGTMASIKDEPEKNVDDESILTIEDEVMYDNLDTNGVTYKLVGTLMDPETKKPFVDSQGKTYVVEKEFQPSTESGTVKLSFPIVAKEIKKLVIFESLYEVKPVSKLVSIHNDIDNKNQTIVYVSTKADINKTEDLIDGDSIVVITDHITYKGLDPEREEGYKLTATLMDTDKKVPFIDADGNGYSKEVVIHPETSDGECEVTFEVKQKYLTTSITFFESIYRDDKLVGFHGSVDDTDETIPEVKTTLTDDETKEHYTITKEKVELTDVVSVKNIEIGKEYKVTGVLMDADSKKPLLVDGKEVTAETTFVSDAKDMEVELHFVFNSVPLNGVKTVAFETLWREEKLAVHCDINSEPQTVVINPQNVVIQKIDQNNNIVLGAELEIQDTKGTLESWTVGQVVEGWEEVFPSPVKEEPKDDKADGKEPVAQAEDGEEPAEPKVEVFEPTVAAMEPQTVEVGTDIWTITDREEVATISTIKDGTVFEVNLYDLTITHEDGTHERFVVDAQGQELLHRVQTYLPEGGYTLHEATPPEKVEGIEYLPAKDVDFEVELTDEQILVQMIDIKTDTVEITKYDATNMKELSGAKLKVTDKDGKVVDEWTSTKEQHPIQGLVVGETYKLTETIAPKGYAIAETIEFTVADNGKVVQQVKMLDKLLPKKKTKTGITNGTTAMATGFVTCALVAGLMIIKRRKANKA